MEKLATTQAKFDENVLDATNAWTRPVSDAGELVGLPDAVVARARAEAEKAGRDGWLFTLDAPNYQAVLTHAEYRPLRQDFYTAWVTRASEQGAPQWDNTALMEEILALRHEAARLVGLRELRRVFAGHQDGARPGRGAAVPAAAGAALQACRGARVRRARSLRRHEARSLGRRVLLRAAQARAPRRLRGRVAPLLPVAARARRPVRRGARGSMASGSSPAATSRCTTPTSRTTTSSVPTGSARAASSSTCTRARRSAAARGWTSAWAGSAWPTRPHCRSRTSSAISRRRRRPGRRC